MEASSKAEQGVQSLGDVPWNVFRKSKALWGLVSVHSSFGVGPLVCLSWLPSYYSDVGLCLDASWLFLECVAIYHYHHANMSVGVGCCTSPKLVVVCCC